MAGTLNKVMLIGNLGKDPEILHFDNGGSNREISTGYLRNVYKS
jgi:single-stranded DNA-binding protein